MPPTNLRSLMLKRMLERQKKKPRIDVPTVIVNVDLSKALDHLTDEDGRLKVTDKFSPRVS